MVPPVSDRIPPVPPYSGFRYVSTIFRVRGSHALRRAFPDPSPIQSTTTSRPYNPACAVTPTVWAPPLSLTTTRGITVVLFSCGYLDVSVPRVRPCSAGDSLRLPGSPIRTSADHRIFAPTRGFSQLVTSFFASESHRHPPCALFYFLVLCFLICLPSPNMSMISSGPWPCVPGTSALAAPDYAKNRFCSGGLNRPRSRKGSLERRCSSHTFRYGYLVTT